MIYTDQFIQELITCPKTIIEAPKDSGISRGSSKTVLGMQSVDGQYSFSGFISVNINFQENFSIGLVFIPREEKGRICLLRCNGFHGEVMGIPHHSFCHIHTVKADDLNNGVKVEKQIHQTTAYSTIADAIQFYVKHINIIPLDREKYFPPPSAQMELSF